ncbi:Ankyrin repeat domain-containing protein 55 [Gonapodya sp. JEL0774]|nr:Ankyrin repeat domain-containing protein 55 [Gonapodya sp. JEL0774]
MGGVMVGQATFGGAGIIGNLAGAGAQDVLRDDNAEATGRLDKLAPALVVSRSQPITTSTNVGIVKGPSKDSTIQGGSHNVPVLQSLFHGKGSSFSLPPHATGSLSRNSDPRSIDSDSKAKITEHVMREPTIRSSHPAPGSVVSVANSGAAMSHWSRRTSRKSLYESLGQVVLPPSQDMKRPHGVESVRAAVRSGASVSGALRSTPTPKAGSGDTAIGSRDAIVPGPVVQPDLSTMQRAVSGPNEAPPVNTHSPSNRDQENSSSTVDKPSMRIQPVSQTTSHDPEVGEPSEMSIMECSDPMFGTHTNSLPVEDPHRPLAPSASQAPLFKVLDSTREAIKEALINETCGSRGPGYLNEVVEETVAKRIEEVEATGQRAAVIAPGLDSTKEDLSSAKSLLRCMTEFQLNILLLHIARTGHIKVLSLLLNTCRLDLNLCDDEGRSALHFAAIAGHAAGVKLLISRGSVIDFADRSGRTALHWAAHYGRVATVKTLIRAGADLRAEDYNRRTPLHCATNPDRTDCLRIICGAVQPRRMWSRAVPGAKSNGLDPPDEDGMTPLHWACFRQQSKHVRLLCDWGADTVKRDLEGKAAAHWAAMGGNVECIQVLQECKSNKHSEDLLVARDSDGCTPLHLACGAGHLAAVIELVRSTKSPIPGDNHGRSPIHWAVAKGRIACLAVLLRAGSDQNASDVHGARPLHYAVQRGRLDCIVMLARGGLNNGKSVNDGKKIGADLDARDSLGRTPAMWAATEGKEEVVRMLVEMGADLQLEDESGATALHIASTIGHCQILLHTLRNFPTLLRHRDHRGRTALHQAAAFGRSDVTELLIREGLNLDAGDLEGRAPLHWAAAAGSAEVVEILLRAGAEVDIRDKSTTTALHEAAYSGDTETVRVLLHYGADVKSEDVGGRTALHWAALKGNSEVVELLVGMGSSVNKTEKGDECFTPLDFAIACGDRPTMELLSRGWGALTRDQLKEAKARGIQRWWRYQKVRRENRKRLRASSRARRQLPATPKSELPVSSTLLARMSSSQPNQFSVNVQSAKQDTAAQTGELWARELTDEERRRREAMERERQRCEMERDLVEAERVMLEDERRRVEAERRTLEKERRRLQDEKRKVTQLLTNSYRAGVNEQ